MTTEDVLAELKAMIACQEERLARLQMEHEQRIAHLQGEMERQRDELVRHQEEKQGLIARPSDMEHGNEGRVSRAGLFKFAAAGAAGLLGVGALENNGTGVALADSPPTTFISTTTDYAIMAKNTAPDGSGGGGIYAETYEHNNNAIEAFHNTTGPGMRGSSNGGPGVQGISYGAFGVHGIYTAAGTNGVLPSIHGGVFGQADAGGVGVYGSSIEKNGEFGQGTGIGVYGESGSYIGVSGNSIYSDGVYGSSGSGRGVVGVTDTGPEAILGSSDQVGVHGLTNGTGSATGAISAAGVVGESTMGAIGVMGITNQQSNTTPSSGTAVPPPEIPSTASNTGANVGVRGVSYNSTHGVAGISFADPQEDTLGSGIGVQGWSGSGFGMLGKSTSSTGVLGQSQNWYGVQGNSVYGDGVYGVSTHLYGAEVTGGKAPLRLVPSGSAGAPSASGHKAGELYVDSTGILYYFNGSAWKVVQIV